MLIPYRKSLPPVSSPGMAYVTTLSGGAIVVAIVVAMVKGVKGVFGLQKVFWLATSFCTEPKLARAAKETEAEGAARTRGGFEYAELNGCFRDDAGIEDARRQAKYIWLPVK